MPAGHVLGRKLDDVALLQTWEWHGEYGCPDSQGEAQWRGKDACHEPQWGDCHLRHC